jgi:hypothetical protein
MRHQIIDSFGGISLIEDRYQCVNCGKTFKKIPDPLIENCDGPFIEGIKEPSAF